MPCAVLLFIGGYYARMDHLGIFVDINTFSFGLILPKEGIRMTIVDPAALQAFCAFATLVLTVYVAWRDTKQMKSEETRRKEAEMLAQPSSIAAWLERSSSGEACLVIRNESDLPVYEVVVTIVVTYGPGCSKGEDLGPSYQYRKKFDLVPSGLYSSDIDICGFGGMHRHPLVEIAFACANGTFWVRRGNGVLIHLDSSPFNYYELGLPVEFDSVTPYQKS